MPSVALAWQTKKRVMKEGEGMRFPSHGCHRSVVIEVDIPLKAASPLAAVIAVHLRVVSP